MKVSPVKQFVAKNVKRLIPDKRNYSLRKNFDMYGESGNYLGDIFYSHNSKSSSIVTRIMDSQSRKPVMQEAVIITRSQHKSIKDEDCELKTIPTTISAIRTTVDYVNDKFTTTRIVRELKNKLVRIGKNDKDFYYDEKHPIYESLKEKPIYKVVEESVMKEGSITELEAEQQKYFKKHHFPYKYW